MARVRTGNQRSSQDGKDCAALELAFSNNKAKEAVELVYKS